MMKKTRCGLVLTLVLLVLLAAQACAQPVEVSTADELFDAILANHGETILMKGDIDVEGRTADVYFSGVLDGNGYALTGVAIYAGQGGACGLFKELSGGVVRNLQITDATVDVTAQGSHTQVGVICGLLDGGAIIENCRVTGEMRVAGGSGAQNIFVGGIAGHGVNGSVISSKSEMDITVNAYTNAYAGGLIGIQDEGVMRSSSYCGDLLIVQTSSDSGVCQAYGNGLSRGIQGSGLSVEGSVRVQVIGASGLAVGIDGADNSENLASVSVMTSGADAVAVGGRNGRNLINRGGVTAQIDAKIPAGTRVTAYGLMNVSYSDNLGGVSASAQSGAVKAVGVSGADGHVSNQAPVTARCEEGSASATGLSGGDGAFMCSNTGLIQAFSNSGSVSAIGLSDCKLSENHGNVSVDCSKGQASAQGMTSCTHSENYGQVSGVYDGEDKGSLSVQGISGCTASYNRGAVSAITRNSATTATATGSSGGTYNVNMARVDATSEIGNANARGVSGDYGQNHGTVHAESTGEVEADVDNATAYGIYSGRYCYNTGSVEAISNDGGAHAHGGASDTNVSRASVSAVTNRLDVTEEDGQIHVVIGRAFAYSSTQTDASCCSGGVSSAYGEKKEMYYFVPLDRCEEHNGMSRGFVIYADGEELPDCDCGFLSCGIAESSKYDSYAEPPMPEAPAEPADTWAEPLALLQVRFRQRTALVGDEVYFDVTAFGGNGAVLTCEIKRDGAVIETCTLTEKTGSLIADQAGDYMISVSMRDSAGQSAGPIVSTPLTVYSDEMEEHWLYGCDIYESVVAGDNIWIGNLYGVCYDGEYLTHSQFEVSVTADGGDAVFTAVPNPQDDHSVFFYVTGGSATRNTTLNITVHKTGEASERDLVIQRSIRVLTGSDVVPPALTAAQTGPITLQIGESMTIDKPVLAQPEMADTWWIGWQLSDWGLALADEDDEYRKITLTATKAGTGTIEFYPASGYYRGEPQIVRQIIVPGESVQLSIAEIAAGVQIVPSARENAPGSVTWSLQGIPEGQQIQIRCDLYRNGILLQSGEWQTEAGCAFSLTEPGAYEVRAVLQNQDGETADCPAVESAKMLISDGADMTIPSELLWIQPEAFVGIAAKEVVLQQGMQTIDARAFADSGVKILRIPGTVSGIAEDAFDGAEDILLVCQMWSYAAGYAEDHGIPYIIID